MFCVILSWRGAAVVGLGWKEGWGSSASGIYSEVDGFGLARLVLEIMGDQVG